MKRCPGCEQSLPLSAFNKGKEKGGVQAYCRECARPRVLAAYRKRKAANPIGTEPPPEAICAECNQLLPGSAFYKRRHGSTGITPYCKPCHRVVTAAAKHGITRDEARALLAEGMTCAICGGKRKLVIDHCHDTGRVRGVLCWSCNVGIGHFANDPERLDAAARYLR